MIEEIYMKKKINDFGMKIGGARKDKSQESIPFISTSKDNAISSLSFLYIE